MPLGLGGEWVLRKASCQQCRDITSGIELDVLRKTLLPARAKMNLPPRHKDERPNKFPLTVERQGQQETTHIPTDKHPTLLCLPRFKSPAYIDKRHYKQGIHVNGVYTYLLGYRSLQHIREELNADSVTQTVTFNGFKDGFSFARLLAKIAYVFAMAHFGVVIIDDAYGLPSILGQSDNIGMWVGSARESLNATSNLHEVKLSVKDGDI